MLANLILFYPRLLDCRSVYAADLQRFTRQLVGGRKAFLDKGEWVNTTLQSLHSPNSGTTLSMQVSLGIVAPATEVVGMEVSEFAGQPWCGRQRLGDMSLLDSVILQYTSFKNLSQEAEAVYVAENFGVSLCDALSFVVGVATDRGRDTILARSLKEAWQSSPSRLNICKQQTSVLLIRKLSGWSLLTTSKLLKNVSKMPQVNCGIGLKNSRLVRWPLTTKL